MTRALARVGGVEPRAAPRPAARRCGWHTRSECARVGIAGRGRGTGRCRSAPARAALPGCAARKRAIDVGRAARVQRDQQRRRRPSPSQARAISTSAHRRQERAASAPPCASCRCWPRRAPARRCRRAARRIGAISGMIAHGAPACADARRLAGDALAAALRDSRATTLALADRPERRAVARAAAAGRQPGRLGARPPRLVRRVLDPARPAPRSAPTASSHAARPARIAGPDALFDSARLAHADALARRRCRRATELARDARRAARRLPRRDPATATTTTPLLLPPPRAVPRGHARRGLRLAARDARLRRRRPACALPRRRRGAPLRDRRRRGAHRLAARPRRGFAFDNELPGRRVRCAPFEIDAAPVTHGAFLRFVEAGGYDDPAFWPGDAGAGARAGARPSARWRRATRRLADALVRPLAAARSRRSR